MNSFTVLTLPICAKFYSQMSSLYFSKVANTYKKGEQTFADWFVIKFKEHFVGNYSLRYSTQSFEWLIIFPTPEDQTAFILRYT